MIILEEQNYDNDNNNHDNNNTRNHGCCLNLYMCKNTLLCYKRHQWHLDFAVNRITLLKIETAHFG